MILRRFIQHVREQNWFAVGLDFAIVVAGVFLAVQIGNWSEAVQERSRFAAQLDALELEYREHELRIDGYRARITSQLEYVRSVRTQFGLAERTLDDDAIQILPLNIFSIPNFAWGMSTQDMLRSDTAMRRLTPPELHDALVAWEADLSYVSRLEAASLRNRDLVAIPILQRSTSFPVIAEHHEISGEYALESRFPSDFDVLAANREFDGLLAGRTLFLSHILAQFDDLERSTTAVLDVLTGEDSMEASP
ncbi:MULTISPECIES: hypothetical protein [Alphaproteobacteria]|uniref:hypothetical protein n=1 Tax=Alphaproteobacteria TaxID=28211 RepID=UPI0035178C8D